MLLGASSIASSQPLDSLVQRAIELHPSIEGARMAIRQADANARGAGAWSAPSAGLEFSELPPSHLNPFARGETLLMVEQMIPLFGQNSAMARAMSVGAEAGEATVERLQRELRARVEREYYTIWLLDRRQEVNAENRRNALLLYKTAEARYITNSGHQSDLLRIQIEEGRLQHEAAEIAEDRVAAQGRLNGLISMPIESPVQIARPIVPDTVPPFDSLAALISGSPQLREMEAMARMSEAQAVAEESMLKPMLMLRGGLAYMPEGHPLREGNFSPTSEVHGSTAAGSPEVMHWGVTISGMLTLPFLPWSRSGPEGRAESYRIEGARRLEERDAMRTEMTSMLRTAYSDARRAGLRRDFYRTTQIPLLERSLQSISSEYATGSVPFSTVVDTYSMLAMARLDAYMQEMEYAMSLSMISQQTGWRPHTVR
jgi:outer membrane protein TolC